MQTRMSSRKNRDNKPSFKGKNRFGSKKNFSGSRKRNEKNFSFGRKGKKSRSSFDPSHFINQSEIGERALEDKLILLHENFDKFGFSKLLLSSLKTAGMSVPTPIQDKIIPSILEGKNVVGLAETGTGKTAAFLLPLIQKTIDDNRKQTLIITPTRELSTQIDAELKILSRGTKIRSTVCVGGVGIRPQIVQLRQNPAFVIGTPGRLIDLIDRGAFKTDRISAVVLDEADRMLDMGFIDDIKKILDKTPDSRETHLFSATMTASARRVVKDYLHNSVEISVKKKETVDGIDQDVVIYSLEKKFEILVETLKKIESGRVLIFGEMKHSVEKLSIQLKQSGLSADSIHGDKSFNQRKRSLEGFKSGQVSILVATDVVARGIHVNNITHVINYDLPNCFEDYIHRIGRTGRVNHTGKALTFISETQIKSRRR